MAANRSFSCNSCVTKLKLFSSTSEPQTPVKSYLTNCQHLLCANCRLKVTTTCIVCQKKCCVIAVDEKLPRNIRVLFTSLEQCYQDYQTAQKFHAVQDSVLESKLRIYNTSHEKKKIQQQQSYRASYQKAKHIEEMANKMDIIEGRLAKK